MLIVSVDKLREGMQLADNVYSTSATEYKLLYKKATFLSFDMIETLRKCGIKTVNVVGWGIESDSPAQEEEPVPEKPKRPERVINQNITHALTDLNGIFDGGTEGIKELSVASVKRVDDIADNIIADITGNSDFLANQMIALQNFDDYTYKHCLRVAMLSAGVCAEIGLSADEKKDIVLAGLLHDIGKSNIDHEIIIKPGKLTDKEFEEIKRHPLIGYNILKKGGHFSPNVLSGVLFHQEKYDGTGYPTGISGKKIPLVARILSVCDVFDALTSNRPYRKPWSVAETEEYILGAGGTHFDLDVATAFLHAFNPYPIGTIVTLSDGR
ncbi:MAG TPA: hypothetical protein DER68_05750, partial [Ruminococcaceae bacterium]|nr:hypothetical protein [Oscillospiraceae bacterium]